MASAAALLLNGLTPLRHSRYADIPHSIDIPVSAGDEDDDDETAVVEVDPNGLPDDPTELCTLLENERSPRQFWMYIALAYAKHERVDIAIEIMTKGLQARAGDTAERLPMLNLLTWLYLQRSREAARNVPEGAIVSEAKTKDYYLQLATQALNESSRLDPSSVISGLARGVYSVFKASVSTSAERGHHLDTATKIFDDAIRSSRAGNMLATLGKARVLYARRRFDKALECYQEVLLKRPDMDPDPRLGIGLCFWSLGHKDDAAMAWERALELDPASKVAHILLALYHLAVTAATPEYDPKFMENYRQVIDHTQKAYKIDKNFPMACTTFSSHFFSKKGYTQCEALAKKAIEYSDVAAVTADGWYLLARKWHAEGDWDKALTYYRRSDSLREGWLPAKLGVGQVQVLMKDISSAKYTFEAVVQSYPKCLEAKTILGTLYAHEVLQSIPRTGFAASKEDVTDLHRRAIGLLEGVRATWKDKKTDPTREALLLTLARLYENDQPDKALACLQAVHDIYTQLRETDDEAMAPLQLLNNMATFYWHSERYDLARQLYQTALSAIPELKERAAAAAAAATNADAGADADDDDDTATTTDTDALATTLTYNLARCEEAAGNLDEATKQYEQLLARHDDYVDANMRLAYMALRRGGDEGPRRIQRLMHTDGHNLEVRALYGWYLGKQKRKAAASIAEDPEQRHYKHSLQYHDKHDRYSLTGMGNLYLLTAREMRRDSEQEKEKRRKTYEKAVEFFDKALQLDPKNAYAAQGVAIAMVEDRKDLKSAVQVFTKVKETLARDAHALVNLGHCLAGLEQWARAIENYETALTKFQHGKDPTTLTCLGRVWFAKGKKERESEPEKSLESFKNALEYAKRALAIAPDNVMFMFNVAFVQFQIVQFSINLPETLRTLEDLEAASKGLDEAIQMFTDVAHSKNPPYPAPEIEARSTMGRNTLRKQMERALQKQREYEEKNAFKLAEARRKRDEDIARRQAAADAVRRGEEERKRAIAEQRRRMQEEAREYAERKAAEEMARDDGDFDGDGEKRKKRGGGGGGGGAGGGGSRSGRSGGGGGGSGGGGGGGGSGGGRSKRKQKDETVGSDTESDAAGVALAAAAAKAHRNRSKSAITDDDGEKPPAKKRKKLTRRRAASPGAGRGKFKSSEVVNSSDDDDLDDLVVPATSSTGAAGAGAFAAAAAAASASAVSADEGRGGKAQRKRKPRAAVSDDEDEDGMEDDLFGDDEVKGGGGAAKADVDMPDRAPTPGGAAGDEDED